MATDRLPYLSMTLESALEKHRVTECDMDSTAFATCYDVPDSMMAADARKKSPKERLLSFLTSSGSHHLIYSSNFWPALLSGFYPKHGYYKCHSCGLCLAAVDSMEVDIIDLHAYAVPNCGYLMTQRSLIRHSIAMLSLLGM